MQPAHFGDGDDAASVGELYTAWIRRILVQCEMRASAVIVADERLKMPAQAGLVEHNKVIKAFATDGANHSFDIGALLRRAWGRQYLFDTHRLHLLDEITAEDAATIAQQEARLAVPRKSFPELLRSPLGSGMCSHREVDDAATLVCHHQKT